MLITLDRVRIGHGPGAALPEITLAYETGKATVVATETEQRPTVLSLVAAGRMAVDAGTVAPANLRFLAALVDTPNVAEAPAEVTLLRVVREELALAGSRRRAADLLAEHGLTDYAKVRFSTVPPLQRIRLLCELALLRKGVTAIVLTSPERHGAHPADWWRLARDIASRGVAVLVVTDRASADLIEQLEPSEELS